MMTLPLCVFALVGVAALAGETVGASPAATLPVVTFQRPAGARTNAAFGMDARATAPRRVASPKQADKQPIPPPPVPSPAPPPDDDLPSLDELLGTGKDKPADAPGAPDAEKANLDKLLSGAELGQAFEQAVGFMKDAAKRLGDTKDVGITTQRVQEDALRKLDQLISSLDRQAQQQPQSQSEPGEPEDGKGPPRQRRPQPGQPSETPASGEPQDSPGPTLKEGALNPELESARAAWGALPARVRQMLMQGSNDRFSSMYNRLTQEYYRRLAEESSARP